MGRRKNSAGSRKARRGIMVATLIVGVAFAGYNKVEAFLTGGGSVAGQPAPTVLNEERQEPSPAETQESAKPSGSPGLASPTPSPTPRPSVSPSPSASPSGQPAKPAGTTAPQAGRGETSPTPSPQPTAKPANGSGKASGKVIRSGPADERKLVALTFDDGPDPKWTPLILDLLNKAGVKATFFVVGQQAAAHPDVLKRIAEEGHAIGNHSWNHSNMTSLKPEEMREQVTKTDELIASVTGKHSAIFRPPYGAVSDEVLSTLASMNTHVVNWSVDTKDWAGTPVADMMAIVNHQVKPGAIVLQHSFGGKKGDLSNTVEALPQIIAYLKKNGYTFVTVPEMLP
ncbi:hypothetical protein J31TS4_21160 [Paenibacillus sp. J31TS4]|uniref:polysaccharide deacetylase family protein n=1 Tax=Paenibacillus sp. J31TS4 TaxID=2807195 RepID=UPI001B26D1D9|nr:polysaccharide deacetylase family protein [Paenibacillus sp. J31TS4]GIP38836.1 hypothetical protein J31TS4_21160 [Paenibacillus sp. J31TS4]